MLLSTTCIILNDYVVFYRSLITYCYQTGTRILSMWLLITLVMLVNKCFVLVELLLMSIRAYV